MGGDPHLGLDVALLLTAPALILINGFFVAAEYALVSVRRTRIEELVGKGVQGALAVEKALANITRSIAATQLGITITSIALGFVAEPALANLFEPLFVGLAPTYRGVATHTAAGIVALFIVTFCHVVFGEMIPKALTLRAPDTVALWSAAPLSIFARITRPLVVLMLGTANLVLRCFGLEGPSEKSLAHTVEELSLLVEDTEEAGILDPDQAELVQNVFRLSNKRVADCLVPRDKMMALELNTPPEKVLEAVRSGAHTRIPVYEGEINNIVGIVNTKNLFFLFSLQGVVILQDAMYPALFLKPEESIANALRLFKKSKRPMALVRDDAGQIRGLLTLEDILEEIVGELEDEHDAPMPRLILRGKKSGARPRPAPGASASVPQGQTGKSGS